MMKQRYGRIVNITSVVGASGNPGLSFTQFGGGFTVSQSVPVSSVMNELWPGPTQRLPLRLITGVPPTRASRNEAPSLSRNGLSAGCG